MKIMKSKNLLKSFVFICLVIITATSVNYVMAASLTQVDNTYTPLAPLPCIPGGNVTCSSSVGSSLDFKTYVGYAFNLLMALGAVAAVLMITWGGFDYMTSDAIQGKKEGLNKIKNAVYGLLLVLCSILILRTVNPQFVEVPLGLVPPANLAQPTNTLSSWENQLNSALATLDANSVNTKSDLQNINNQVATLDSKAQNLASQISNYTGEDPSYVCVPSSYDSSPDPKLDQLCTDYLNTLDSKQSAIADGTAKVQTIDFNNKAKSALNNPSQIDTAAITALDTQYSNDQKLVTSGETAADLQALNNAYYSARAAMQIAIAGNMANSNVPSDYLNQINDAIINDIPRIKDPVVQQTAITHAITSTESLMAIHRSNTAVYSQLKTYDSQLMSMIPAKK